MSQDLLNLLSNSNKDIDNQLLMDYVAGKLSDSKKHEVEKLMAESGFINDAMEGLENTTDPKDLSLTIDQLNRDLHKKLSQRKTSRYRRSFKDSSWTYLAIILIVAMAVIAYLIIHKLQGR